MTVALTAEEHERRARRAPGAALGRRLVEAAFRGDAGQRVLTLTHRPRRPSGAGVVICSSIGSERIRNHRRELALATTLAGRGVVVERFHFRGSGDSDGDSLELGFDSMRDDTVAAVERLVAEHSVERVALLGTRLGGLVAAAAVGRLGSMVPLVLWEPVVAPRAYFEEIFRYKLIQEVMQSRFKARATDETLGAALEASGVADVLGFPLTRKLYDESVKHSLGGELRTDPRPLMLVQIRAASELCAEYSNLEAALRAAGSTVETRIFRERIAWWFLAKFYRDQNHDPAIVEDTADWLEAQLIEA